MLIKIGNFEFTSVWDGVFYKKLSQYPKISDWERWQISFEKGNLKAIFLKSLLNGYFIEINFTSILYSLQGGFCKKFLKS